MLTDKPKTMKRFYLMFLVPFIISCSDKSSEKNILDKRNIGVQISNHMIGGAIYSDSAKKVYAFRSIRSVIKNDTIVPIKIHIDISKIWTDMEPKQGQKYICFLLPDSMTSDKQFAIGNFTTPQLNSIIDTKLDLLRTRTFTIQPNDTFSFKIGYLIMPTDGVFRAILFSQEKFGRQTNDSTRKTSSYDLRLNVTIPPVSSAISIGSLTFLNE